MTFVKHFIAIAIACAAFGNHAWAADVREARETPVLVELFTSEGCSSCPPADALLQKLDASSPVPGIRLIVLSEHVDYWNGDGWKDPYSSSLFTQRQDAYCRSLNISDPYTPQIIVDGGGELHARTPEQVVQTFQKAAAAQKVVIRIASVKVEAATPLVVRGRIGSDGDSEKHNADLYVALALDHAESQVLRGENTGRHLTHVAVVESLRKVGKMEHGMSLAKDFEMKLKPGIDPANIRIVAFLQEPGAGKVLGAALQRPPIQ
ncbi:MAG TPA: DUF1223 domain-containing protein [Bryobacteraceae bacterium]|jgi:hypothetical protein